jgi:hypothetical protein
MYEERRERKREREEKKGIRETYLTEQVAVAVMLYSGGALSGFQPGYRIS